MAEDTTNQEVTGQELSEHPDEAWVTDQDAVEDRNFKWREVIDELMSGKYITDAYAKAYDIDLSVPRKYNIASSNGSRLLRNAKFKELWRKVIEERGFNDETVDWALTDLITNPAVEHSVRRAAIKDYNELLGRVVKKVDHTTKGKAITPPAIISPIEPRDAQSQTETASGN